MIEKQTQNVADRESVMQTAWKRSGKGNAGHFMVQKMLEPVRTAHLQIPIEGRGCVQKCR